MGEQARAHERRVVVTVARTGGIAGLRREWRVEPPLADATRWESLIDRCPWDAPPGPVSGADRYVWHLRACTRHQDFARAVPDAELSGAWRALVDAVREHAGE